MGSCPGWLTPSLGGQGSTAVRQGRYIVVLGCSFERTLKGQTVSPLDLITMRAL